VTNKGDLREIEILFLFWLQVCLPINISRNREKNNPL